MEKIALKINRLWVIIANIGIDDNNLDKEVVKYRMLNQLIVLAMLTSMLADSSSTLPTHSR